MTCPAPSTVWVVTISVVATIIALPVVVGCVVAARLWFDATRERSKYKDTRDE